jgi:hypothetical protein
VFFWLAIPGTTTLGPNFDEISGYPVNFAVIEQATKSKARNLLVAGTGNQKALWVNGGVFTKALISGLAEGKADLWKDRVIQFDELALYISNKFAGIVQETKEEQQPGVYHGSGFGKGSFLFLPTL